MAYLKLFDGEGRPVRVLVLNESEDGSGVWHVPLVDSSGRLVVGTSTASIGKLAANSGVDIGDVDILSIAAGTNVVGKVRLVTATGDEITNDTADGIKATLYSSAGSEVESGSTTEDTTSFNYRALWVYAIQMFHDGSGFARKRIPKVFKRIDAVAITAGSGAVVWTPTSTKKFRLLGWSLSSSASAALEFHDGAVTATPALQTPLLAAAGIHTSPDLGNGYISTTADNVLTLDVTGNSTVSGMVWGTEE